MITHPARYSLEEGIGHGIRLGLGGFRDALALRGFHVAFGHGGVWNGGCWWLLVVREKDAICREQRSVQVARLGVAAWSSMVVGILRTATRHST